MRRECEKQCRDFAKRLFLGCEVAIAHRNFGRKRQRRGDQLVAANAGSACGGVGGHHAWIVSTARDDEGPPRIFRRSRAREDIERKGRQQQTGPQHAGASGVR